MSLRATGVGTFLFLSVFLAFPHSTLASTATETCSQQYNTTQSGGIFDPAQDSAEYSPQGYLIYHFHLKNPSVAGDTFFFSLFAQTDHCSITSYPYAQNRPVSLSDGVSDISIRFTSMTEFAVWDDTHATTTSTGLIEQFPSYINITPYFYRSTPDAFDYSGHSYKIYKDGAPPIFENKVNKSPSCQGISGFGNSGMFDYGYERAEYVDGLLRVHLRFDSRYIPGETGPRYAFRSSVIPIMIDDCALPSFQFQTFPQVFDPHNVWYYSYRMTSPTHWVLWDDEHDVAFDQESNLCGGCSGDIQPGAKYVFWWGEQSGFDWIHTTPFAPVEPVTTCTPGVDVNCNSNVLFLPGIEGSRLYRPQAVGNPEQKLWEPSFHDNLHDLFLNPQGKSVRDDIYAKEGDVIEETPIGTDVYKPFIEAMGALKAQGKINDWESAPYDWRLSLDDILAYGKQDGANISYINATNTPYIIQELRDLAVRSKTGKVTIIAHSNGGLVAKALTEKLGTTTASQLIDKIIFVAVPQAGTPEAISDGLHGAAIGYGLVASKNAVRTFASTSPMMYHLLPSAKYFTYVDDPVVSFDPSLTDWISRYGSVIHSQQLLHSFLTDTYGRVDAETGDTNQPIKLSDTLLTKAETLHADLDNWTPPTGVKLIQVAGWGIPTTLSGITYTKEGSGIKPNANTTIDGDGTVVVPSALWTSTTTGAVNYWVDLGAYSFSHWVHTVGTAFPYDHGYILAVSNLLSFVSDEVTNSVQPLSSYSYLSTAAPPSTDRRLRYELHSPLTLDLYDDVGHHTGMSTTTGQLEEQIPGTYYMELGDTKYLFTGTSASVHVLMRGYATGTFTFNVDELQGDALIASTTFKDIPTNPQTIVTMNVQSDINTLSPMRLDLNGDGTTDYNLSPKLNDIVTLDNTPPITLTTVAGTAGINGWYTSNAIVTLNATDTNPSGHGSGVANTFFSLDGAATSTGRTVVITVDGIHTLRYYSVDNQGNKEALKTIVVKIDKTSPEAVISASTSTKDLIVTGIDNLSTTTVTKTTNTTTIADQAGNITTLTFQKTFSGNLLTYAKLTSIKYGTSSPVSLPSSFVYIWNPLINPPILLSQTVAVDSTFAIQATYDKSKNKTTVIVKKKGTPIQTTVVSGLALVKLTTNRGTVGYSW